ncbi:hypothetical protein LP52_21855 [Streptomonospora alba]|uniref:Uncharacterized protein n=1 Tax=Streptomonospora alba TaxID=183763 RepID=A0A0C2JJ38_9ACTN|nr:hypothetical protein LP52_21855 [Streptomonospora alba]
MAWRKPQRCRRRGPNPAARRRRRWWASHAWWRWRSGPVRSASRSWPGLAWGRSPPVSQRWYWPRRCRSSPAGAVRWRVSSRSPQSAAAWPPPTRCGGT